MSLHGSRFVDASCSETLDRRVALDGLCWERVFPLQPRSKEMLCNRQGYGRAAIEKIRSSPHAIVRCPRGQGLLEVPAAGRDTMNREPWHQELTVALGVVREGAALARDTRRRFGEHALLKADRSPVTIADFSVQALVADRLGRAFPDDPLVAEEDAALLQRPDARPLCSRCSTCSTAPSLTCQSMRFWRPSIEAAGCPVSDSGHLTQLMGTQGFVRGDQYVVALALVVGGRVEIGLLGCPALSVSIARPSGRGVKWALLAELSRSPERCFPFDAANAE
jgi:hypothetical protein